MSPQDVLSHQVVEQDRFATSRRTDDERMSLEMIRGNRAQRKSEREPVESPIHVHADHVLLGASARLCLSISRHGKMVARTHHLSFEQPRKVEGLLNRQRKRSVLNPT
jgi:hypothetical protein